MGYFSVITNRAMIVRDFYDTRFDGVRLYKTYSDSKKMIRQVETGVIYSEAIDVETAPYTYEETDLPIEDTDNGTDIQ